LTARDSEAISNPFLGPPSLIVRIVVALGAFLGLALAMAWGGWSSPLPDGPNIVIILTDDQSYDTVPSSPPAMPYLQSQMEDPNGHWTWFPNAFINTGLCCPSRATILTGDYAYHTGVLRNQDGAFLDDSSTIATWFQDAGYDTALIGKYLNRYPFRRTPFVPPGWDHWVAKEHGNVSTVYYNYTLFEAGVSVTYGAKPEDYMPDVLTGHAVEFIEDAPSWKPWFLYFAPTAPHAPWIPAPRYVDTFADATFPPSKAVTLDDLTDMPEWVSDQNPIREEKQALLEVEHRAQFQTLRAADDGIRAIVEALAARGELDNTIIVFLSDNGYSFGEHRVIAKKCPYDECSRVPFLVRMPTMPSSEQSFVVGNADVAPTIAALAGVSPPTPVDGLSFANLLRGGAAPDRQGVLLEWAGDRNIPAYWGLRTERYLYVEYPFTGERELYDIFEDPAAINNVAGHGGYAAVQERLASDLHAMIPAWGP